MGEGREILQALNRAFQLHQNADYQVSQVNTPPSPENCSDSIYLLRVFTHVLPFAAPEENLARKERRDDPAVLPDESARAAQRRAGAQEY